VGFLPWEIALTDSKGVRRVDYRAEVGIHNEYSRKEGAIMAYINSEWLNREERAQRITLLTERVTKLAAVIKAGKATDYHIDSFRRDKRNWRSSSGSIERK
jgi:hypothetical protein